MRLRLTFFLFALLSSIGPAGALERRDEPEAIVVTADRLKQAEISADQASAITLRPPIDTPMPRRYSPVCVRLFGIDPAYGQMMKQQIERNVSVLGLPIGRPGCQPNVLIGFVRDSKTEVASLVKNDPTLFDTLASFEIDRVFGGSGAAQIWHATEVRSADGRPIPIVELDIPMDGVVRKVETGYNSQYKSGRLSSPIRNDINATILVFDRDQANGKTVQQLADYATFRILAPVQDFAEVPAGTMPSILHLFVAGAIPPDGLTEFDWAYLAAFYKLDRGAKASAVHDATKKAMLDGTGQRLREKAADQ